MAASKGYNEIRNYLINELGIDRAMVVEIVNARVDHAIGNALDSKKFQQLVVNEVVNNLEGTPKYGAFDRTANFRKLIKECITHEVLKRIDFDAITAVKKS
jgi:hypothetical protein